MAKPHLSISFQYSFSHNGATRKGKTEKLFSVLLALIWAWCRIGCGVNKIFLPYARCGFPQNTGCET